MGGGLLIRDLLDGGARDGGAILCGRGVIEPDAATASALCASLRGVCRGRGSLGLGSALTLEREQLLASAFDLSVEVEVAERAAEERGG